MYILKTLIRIKGKKFIEKERTFNMFVNSMHLVHVTLFYIKHY